MKPYDDIDRVVERMLDGHEHSRRQFVRVLAGAGLSVSSAGLLAACGGVKGESSGKKASASVRHPKVPIGQWTFSNWPLYIDKSVLKAFDKKYGGHVQYIEDINDNFEFFGKVRQQLSRSQPIGRDIVVLTDYMASRWVRDGFVTAIDQANVPNMVNLVDNLKNIAWDPKRNYSLPWQSGAIGIGYDRRLTGRKLHSIKDLFDPKFKGRVSFLSEPYDSAGMVMLMQGVDSTKASLTQIMNAIDRIEVAQKAGQIRRFTGNDYTTDLAKGNLWAAMAYSGDLVQLKADNPHLEFVYPDEGSMQFTDNMMMPAKAAHPYAAETMMNYVYDPQVAAKIADYVNYISPVKGIKDILLKSDPKVASNPLIFPPANIVARLHPYPSLSPADERSMEDRMAQVVGG
ncbi:MAG: spermidine/putrescine transport system substrate-binding protein [Solirubrobacteraceae bacterium]|jgi:spermidine/putrescine transport system substrate-binding protein|nr:spermidine/putrescine transport system substrate-binding protein [Solirubrobacteraceae bacterium]